MNKLPTLTAPKTYTQIFIYTNRNTETDSVVGTDKDNYTKTTTKILKRDKVRLVTEWKGNKRKVGRRREY